MENEEKGKGGRKKDGGEIDTRRKRLRRMLLPFGFITWCREVQGVLLASD